MLLSIIIPHYNLPKELLEQCIDSITGQGITDDDYEIIIVDDGSQFPPTWIQTLHRDNIKLIESNHGGPGEARNKGIEAARGEYIQFVDADDYLLKNGQFVQCLAILRQERPQILRFNYIVKNDKRAITADSRKQVKTSNTISGAIFMRDNNLSGSPCTYFFRRELAIETDTRFTANIFHEDEEFNTILHYHAQTLIASNATLYCYCIREGSTTANSSREFEARRIDNLFTIIERLATFKEKNTTNANTIQTEGIEHKLRMLTVDAILNMMFDGRKANYIYATCMSRLSPLGLFPLPKASYSYKYRLFRALANRPFGMKILRIIVPDHKPAKK
ncbi:MAG: glycosyltransferase family 2 protein [Bacteroidaceae bacterium]|nr:glycosyltransferase family 2 protein [Bacteroidaceae bacterium]